MYSMRSITRRFWLAGVVALIVALCVVPTILKSSTSYAASRSMQNVQSVQNVRTLVAMWTGSTTDWANVRTGPGTNYAISRVDPPNTTVTVYATVHGQVVWGGISNWYRISSSASLYIYGGLVAASSTAPGGGGSSPSPAGKVIVVSLSHQWLYAYQNGTEVFNAAVITGRPSLATPTGTYHVFAKYSPTTFYSPWPQGSPYWYAPTHINYALEWLAGGFFLHDSYWHTVYGPGMNGWHHDPVYGWQWGSHGCVSMPLNAAAWLYNWAPIGTTVQINP